MSLIKIENIVSERSYTSVYAGIQYREKDYDQTLKKTEKKLKIIKLTKKSRYFVLCQ